METQEDLFYVGVSNPVMARRDLLNSSKALIDGLRRYERYALLREQKFERLVELKRVFDELLVLNKRFRSHLPKVPATKVEAEPVQERQVSKSHMDILEEELANVERRLEALR